VTTPYAVVVGIESYAAGPQWTLSGPHSDAARFTRWLRARGVERSRIALFLAPGAAAVDDVPNRSAEQTPVFDCLTALQQCVADPFIFFWSGHGVADSDDERLLFLADAKQGNYVNLDFTQLLGALRTNPYSALERQLFFVDACANYVYDPAFIDALPRRTIPGQTRNARIQQVVAFAARPGQKARNDRDRQEGVFAAAILDRLDDIASVAALFSVLPEATKQVAIQFAERGEAQGPTLLEIRDAAGNAQVTGTPPPATPAYSPLSVAQHTEMAQLLLNVDWLSDPQKRQTVINSLPEDIRLNAMRNPAPMTDVLNLLAACEDYENGVPVLLKVLQGFAGKTNIRLKEAAKYYESLRDPSC
jgi:hypothetical protein